MDGNPTSLTLYQLWQGLLLKVTHPQRFDDQVEHCHIQWLNDIQFIREQQYSAHTVEDKVTLTPNTAIAIQSLVAGHDAFSLSIDIETTSNQQFTVHYQYQRASANQGDLDVDQYLAQAYKKADEETLQQIKSLARSGEL